MITRLTWFAAGAVSGVVGSAYARRKAREAAARYRPAAIARSTAGRVKARADHVVGAVRAGRTEMREREAEMLADVDPVAVAATADAPPPLDDDLGADAAAPSGRRGRPGPRRRARR